MSGLTHQAARRRKNEFDFELANRLFFRLYQASNLMHKIGSRSVAEFSSTTQQWAVLGALSRPAVRQHGMTRQGANRVSADQPPEPHRCSQSARAIGAY
jgi:hypothetical protein